MQRPETGTSSACAGRGRPGWSERGRRGGRNRRETVPGPGVHGEELELYSWCDGKPRYVLGIRVGHFGFALTLTVKSLKSGLNMMVRCFFLSHRGGRRHPHCPHGPGQHLYHRQQDGGRDSDKGAKGEPQGLSGRVLEVPLTWHHGPEVTEAMTPLGRRSGSGHFHMALVQPNSVWF